MREIQAHTLSFRHTHTHSLLHTHAHTYSQTHTSFPLPQTVWLCGHPFQQNSQADVLGVVTQGQPGATSIKLTEGVNTEATELPSASENHAAPLSHFRVLPQISDWRSTAEGIGRGKQSSFTQQQFYRVTSTQTSLSHASEVEEETVREVCVCVSVCVCVGGGGLFSTELC